MVIQVENSSPFLHHLKCHKCPWTSCGFSHLVKDGAGISDSDQSLADLVISWWSESEFLAPSFTTWNLTPSTDIHPLDPWVLSTWITLIVMLTYSRGWGRNLPIKIVQKAACLQASPWWSRIGLFPILHYWKKIEQATNQFTQLAKHISYRAWSYRRSAQEDFEVWHSISTCKIIWHSSVLLKHFKIWRECLQFFLVERYVQRTCWRE